MMCPVCGVRNRDTASFCIACGFRMSKGSKVLDQSKSKIRKPAKPNYGRLQKRAEETKRIQRRKKIVSSPDLHPIPVSLRMDRYRIVRQLGQGGMGRVFLAHDTALDYPVVVKEMLPVFVSMKQKEYMEKRFRGEAKILFRLKHLSLPRVTDCFEENHSLFLVMEYIEGQNLEQLIKRHPDYQISFSVFIRWINSVLDILKYLHNQVPPVLHRDIKPSNIMLAKRGEIFLVDFGVARTAETMTFTHVGTPGFASLEHYTGKFTPSSDIYSLGATFHYLLTRDDPRGRQDFTFPPLAEYRNDLPVDLQDIFDGMLAIRNEDRYQSAKEVMEDLKILVSEVADEYEEYEEAEYEQEPTVVSGQLSGKRLRAEQIKPRKTKKKESQKVVKHESKDPEFTRWKIIKTLKEHTNNVLSVAITPDGKSLASGSWDRTIIIWNPVTGEDIKTLTGHSDWVCSLAFSSDGNYIISGSYDQTIKIWEVKKWECIRTISGHFSFINFVAFSPDGKYIASSSYDKSIKIWKVESGECIRTLKGHALEVWSIAFSPDGKHLVSGSIDKTIKIWEIETGKCINTLVGHTDWVYSVVFSPDGKYIASGSRDKLARIWNWKANDCINELKGHFEDVGTVTYSADGRFLATGSYDKTIKVWNVKDGSCLVTLNGHSRGVNSVAFFPDAKYLASASTDRSIIIWGARKMKSKKK